MTELTHTRQERRTQVVRAKGEGMVVSPRHPGSREGESHARRIFDIVGSMLTLLIVSPGLVAIAIAIKSNDGGPIFYRALRAGRNGRPFRLYKFRTMVVGADRQGPGITTMSDSRVTRVGQWLRRTKLDELPQLVNVLAGQMSLVGPRPEDVRYVAQYGAEERKVLRARPGITSPASLLYRHEEEMLIGPDWEAIYRNEVIPAKLAIELDYLQRRTIWTDIAILIRTVGSSLR